MALKLTSGSASVSVGISATKIRATVDVINIQSSISSELVTAQTTYQRSNATNIYVDPDTKNRSFRSDTVPLDDIYFTVITKPLSDDAALVDHFANAFGLTKEDSIEFVENFSKTMHFRRDFAHAFTLDDSALIDKDFYGNKGNIFGLDEIYTASLSKGVSDDFSLGEEFVLALQFYREFSHSVEFTELYSADVQKGITDTLDGLEDALGISTTKLLDTDTTTLTETNSLKSSLVKSDTISNITDTSVLGMGLGKEDGFDFTDNALHTFTKVLSDGFALDDAALINKNYTGTKGNIFGLDEVFERSVKYQRLFNLDTIGFSDGTTVDSTLGKSDSIDNISDLVGKGASKLLNTDKATVTEEASFYSVLPKTDSIDNVTDVNIIALDKAVQNSMGIGDEYSRIVSYKRSITDGFTLDDAALIDKDYYGNKGNLFTFSEDFARAVEYKRSFTVDTIEFTEERTVGINLSKSDPVVVDDSSILDLLLSKSDGYFLEDISQTDTLLAKADTTYVDDEIGKGVSKELKANFYHLGAPTVVNETSFINNYGYDYGIHSVEIAIARLANGTNIHVWSQDLAQNSIGIWGKIYNGNVPIGDAFQINTHTPLIQTQPAVAALSDGGFVVTWSSYKQEGYYNNIYGRRYDNQGAAQTAELEIATWMFGEERESEVLGLPGGGYVVVYVSATKLRVKVFNDNDLVIASSIVQETYHVVKLPKLLLLTSGDFVVTFYAESPSSGYNSGYIKARNYTALGVPVVPPGLTYDDAYMVGFSGFSQKSHIVSLSDGGFVAFWTDSVTQQIKGRVFPSDRASNSITDVYQLDYRATNNDYISIEKMSGDTFLIAGSGNNIDLLAPKVMVVDLLTGNYLSVHVNLDLASSNYFIGEVIISITTEEIVAFSWVVDRGNGTEILHQRYNAQELPLGEMEIPISLADSSTLQPSLGKSDSFNYTDNQSNTLHKLLQHGFTLDDATTVNKDYYGSKGNVFAMSEEFSRNVQYSRSFPTMAPPGFQPQGLEFQVSAYTLKAYSPQFNSEVISLIGGGFVVVWQSTYQDHQNAIYAKQYDVNGTEVTPPNPLANNAAGNEFRVNSQMYSTQEFPSATALPDGGFVITWQSANSGQDGDGYGIYAKRYNSNGVEIEPPVALLNTGGAKGNEFLVNTYTLNHQDRPDITALADGGFVITWTSNYLNYYPDTGQDGNGDGVYAQRYSVDGSTNGDEFQVNTQIDGVQRDPSVATLTGGDFIIIWEGSVPDTTVLAVYAQRFNTNGTPVGPEFVANTDTLTNGIKYDADITALTDGGFVITWNSSGQDGSGGGIFAQQYNADGSLYGDEFQVNTYITGSQGSPKVSSGVTQDGGFIITWNSYEQDGDGYGVYAQNYNADGSPYGTEIRVNTHITSHQQYPSVAALSNGDVLITWQSRYQDGDSWGVFAQRYYNAILDADDFTLSETLDNKLNKEILSDTIGFTEDVVIEKISAISRTINSALVNAHTIG